MSALAAFFLGLALGVVFSVAIKAAYNKWVAPKVSVIEADISKDLKAPAAAPVASVPASKPPV